MYIEANFSFYFQRLLVCINHLTYFGSNVLTIDHELRHEGSVFQDVCYKFVISFLLHVILLLTTMSLQFKWPTIVLTPPKWMFPSALCMSCVLSNECDIFKLVGSTNCYIHKTRSTHHTRLCS